MNWSAFFLYLATMLAVFGLVIVITPICMLLDKRIGTYATLGCLLVTISLVGAAIVGMTR